MSGAINLQGATVTATGTVTNHTARVAGFSFLSRGATGQAQIYNLDTDKSVGTSLVKILVPASGGGAINHTYDGNTGIKCDNGIYLSVSSSIVGFLTYF